MALNIQVFKTRALTALLFVAVMLTGLLWNFWSFLILISVIHFGCWFEYIKLVEKSYTTRIDNVIKWFLTICGYTLMVVAGQHQIGGDLFLEILGYQVSLKILFWVFLFICLLIFLFQNRQVISKAKWMSLAGLVYISLSLAALINLYTTAPLHFSGSIIDIKDGRLPIFIIVSIWINDTMAYLVGSFIGKTPLSKISPKKTWEGTLGGIILSIVVITIIIYSLYQLTAIDMFGIALIPALSAIFGTFGDLFESKLKRLANVKDSGSFMPGHGGFLDRFDSLLFAAPAVWLYVKLLL